MIYDEKAREEMNRREALIAWVRMYTSKEVESRDGLMIGLAKGSLEAIDTVPPGRAG